jgi:hypothetical protein
VRRSAAGLHNKLVASATFATVAAAVSSPAAVSTPATAAVAATTTRFLRTRFIHLQRAAFHFHAVEIADRLSGVIARTKLDKAKAARTTGFPVGNDACGGDLISFSDE